MNMPKTVLICGGAKSVFEDIKEAKALITPDGIIAINDVFAELEHVDFFCTNHPEKAEKWVQVRRKKGYKDPYSYWTATNKALPASPKFQTVPGTLGGSGLLAVSVARYLGYQKIILAGIPLTAEGGHFFNTRPWKECDYYRHVWGRNTSLKVDIRSVSGWTSEYFGRPTLEWLLF